MKSFNSNNQKLQEYFTKGITASKLSNILTKFGILENESVTVSLRRGDEVLASSEIEPTPGNNRVETVGMSLKALNTEILNEFLAPTEEFLGLAETIFNMDQTTDKTSQFSLEFSSGNSASVSHCVYLSCNGDCPGGHQCCWKLCP